MSNMSDVIFTDEQISQWLDLTFNSNDLGVELTFREYFYKLLVTLWLEGEGFSGKRPFGNSGWEYDLYGGLVQNSLIPGRLDDYGCIEYVDRGLGNFLIQSMIEFMTLGAIQ
jgi:hypothetical protein